MSKPLPTRPVCSSYICPFLQATRAPTASLEGSSDPEPPQVLPEEEPQIEKPRRLSYPPSIQDSEGENKTVGAGGHGVRLSPRIHQEYTFRHRNASRTPAESGEERLTSGKQYTKPCKTQ